MTDEEMAKEYADRTTIVDENTKAGTDCISLVQDYEGNVIDIHERIKQAFLAGLKAGRLKWHKVADEGYPSKDNLGKTYNVAFAFNERKQEYYSFDCAEYIDKGKFVTHTNDGSGENNGYKVIAWLEIPKE